jgi:hypothetical protein
VSFASKFVHFFVDRDRYPIFDSYALGGLRHHLSGTKLSTDNPPPYAHYVGALNNLVELAGLACSGRELDRYLWLSGLYRTWSRNPSAQINVEAKRLFEQHDAAVATDLLVVGG